MVTEFEKVLMNRDNMTKEEAHEERKNASEMLFDMLEDGAGYEEVEDTLMCEYGLEMDYIMDLLI